MNIYSITNLISELADLLIERTHNLETAKQEAWWLVEKVTGAKRSALIIENQLIMSDEQQEQLQQWLYERIEDKKPLQYILGSVPFVDLEIEVKPPILIPRPETEEIVIWIIDTAQRANFFPRRILDLCTGSGCIALALAQAFPQAQVFGIDNNPEAIELAWNNQKKNKIENVSFRLSDLYDQIDVDMQFDLIVSNPPYVSAESYKKVSDEVRQWEDPRALIADRQGMAVYERIVQDVMKYVQKPHQKTAIPQLVMEIGVDQYDIEKLLERAGFATVKIYKDMQGKDRWVAAWI